MKYMSNLTKDRAKMRLPTSRFARTALDSKCQNNNF